MIRFALFYRASQYTMNSSFRTRLLLLFAILACVVAFFAFDVGRYFSLDYFASQKDSLDAYIADHFFAGALIYFVLYVVVFAFALPAGAILTLAGGALFGFGWGVVLVSFASTIGSTLAFLAARFIARDWVNNRFGDRLDAINQGIEKEGAFYLFTLRLVPVFPPALINLAMGLSSLKTWTFYWVSQLGMLAGTAVYVNAGTELASIDPGEGLLSPGLIFAFVLLGVFPLLAKRVLAFLQSRRVYQPYDKPERFDNNLVVIGAGSGGLVSAYIAATVKAKVTLVERHRMGGDCLNTGCVPSKTLLRSAKIAHYLDRAEEFGIADVNGRVDFAAVMNRVQQAIKRIEPHDSVERYTDLGVDCVEGNATILSPWQVQVDDQVLTTKNIIIATGGRPSVPPIQGIEQVPYFTSDTIWDLHAQPAHLLVIGAGPIGCELAQAFHRLGSDVTIVSRGDQILPKEDRDVADVVQAQLQREGVQLALAHNPVQINALDQDYELIAEHQGGQQRFRFTHLLLATGRSANTENLGLESLGIELADDGTVAVDEYLRTRYPNIYAVGDVAGPYQFTHAASHQAWYASVNALFGWLKKFKADYSVMPWATFTDPEVARVGLSEHEAEERGIAFDVTRYELDDLDRAIADGETKGFVKVITPRGKDKILGATIVGYHAGELINEFIATMKRGGRLNDIMSTIHIYPTLGEANKFAAGEWKKARKPEKLLGYVQRFHQWSRG